MAIFVDKNSKVIVQGITGAEGSYHAERMQKYGTNIVGGVTPGKGGQKTPQGLRSSIPSEKPSTRPARRIPASSCRRRLRPMRSTRRTMPASRFAVCITEGRAGSRHAQGRREPRRGMRIIGPNCPGLDLARKGARRHHAGPRL